MSMLPMTEENRGPLLKFLAEKISAKSVYIDFQMKFSFP